MTIRRILTTYAGNYSESVNKAVTKTAPDFDPDIPKEWIFPYQIFCQMTFNIKNVVFIF